MSHGPVGVHAASAALRRKKGGKHSSGVKGKVTQIGETFDDDHPGKVRLTIELPKLTVKKSKRSNHVDSISPRTERVLVSADFAKGISLGDEISITTTVEG